MKGIRCPVRYGPYRFCLPWYQAAAAAKLARRRAEVQQLLEEYYRLDYEDSIAGINTRFRYKAVSARERHNLINKNSCYGHERKAKLQDVWQGYFATFRLQVTPRHLEVLSTRAGRNSAYGSGNCGQR